MAITESEARELRSLMQSWQRTTQFVGDLLRGGAVDARGLNMEAVRKAVDARTEAEELVMSFWSRVTKP